MENIAKHKDRIAGEWSTNEKVAMEVAIGASIGGARTLCAMKHVGLNVAMDPLMTFTFIGTTGGLVIVVADDPGMHSSQNEQDNRNYARAAKAPMLEPSDSQEAKDFTILALQLSERFDVPVILRTTTRLAHSDTAVTLGEREVPARACEPVRDHQKYVMIPAYARTRNAARLQRWQELVAFADNTESVSYTHLTLPTIYSV